MYAKVASLLVPVLLALPSVSAASTCEWPSASFSLSDKDGFLGQISDGQVRTGNLTTCLTLVGASNGTLSDIYGRPCYVTPFSQFECTAALQPNASPFGFCASGGLLTYYGSTTFYACDTGVGNQKNIYVKDISSPACTAVNLTLEAPFCAPPASCQPTTVYKTAVSVVSEVATVTESVAAVVTKVSPSLSTVVAPTTIVETVVAAGSTVLKPETVTATITKSATVTETESVTIKGTTATESVTVTVTAVGSTVITPTTVVVTKTLTETQTETTTVVKPITVTATALVTETAIVATTKEVETTVVVESNVEVPTTVVVESSVEVPTTVVVKSSVALPTTLTTTITAVVTETPLTTAAPSTTSTSSSTSTSSTCVPSTTLYPNLIIPINSATPNTALGTGFWANLTKSSTEEQDVLLQYDVASKYTGSCELKFMFPNSPVTFPFFLEGDTTIEIFALTSQLTQSATWNNHPSVGELIDTVTLTRGQDTFATSTTCAAGSFQGYLLKCTGDCTIDFFIDYNPPPVGAVLLPC
ncbi:ubiquitin 3 binding protein But2 C-terminal domain-containing protein [Lipomyces kononenkoae]|uniref:Ubiquitin 3 binding protein But2 C-terminal domain-containing protein n=1 Tax=Lipomyces kononenkoae TaxID=34357 RepID=A0ACC3T6B0_LIPKO